MAHHRSKLPVAEDGKHTAYLSREEPVMGYEKPHPLLKVPGSGLAVWDSYIGRWVVHSQRTVNNLTGTKPHVTLTGKIPPRKKEFSNARF